MKNLSGFTLVELLVVVAIVALIAAVAVPSYQHFVTSSRSYSLCGTFIADIESRQYGFYTQNSRFTDDLNTAAGLNMPGALNAGGDLLNETGTCAASVVTANSNSTYVLTVEPEGWTYPECTGLTLTNTGVRGVVAGSTGSVADCWRY
ncbi:MAG: prepilin-type N-terminal cleavage/methylation domain-containing protein [Cellvibrionaceae bacterium]|nr:prepilin-type N-terminal cleavage/methylation domain-containing protein [Cellvibrionaceae bacterium]